MVEKVIEGDLGTKPVQNHTAAYKQKAPQRVPFALVHNIAYKSSGHSIEQRTCYHSIIFTGK